jgi:ABC-type lipoprotein export system ATPase subunit
MNILSVKDLIVRFGEREVLKGINFEADAGAMLSISGKTGSGKTTLLSIISGLLKPDSGEVSFKGKNIFKWNDIKKSRYRNRQIGYVFQSFNLLPDLTAYQNVAYPAILNCKVKSLREEVNLILKALDIYNNKDSYPSTLSGGEKQRVAIARALINKPEMIIADEPTGNLDTETGKSIFRLFNKLRERSGITVIFATHDKYIIKNTDIHYHLKDGLLSEN